MTKGRQLQVLRSKSIFYLFLLVSVSLSIVLFSVCNKAAEANEMFVHLSIPNGFRGRLHVKYHQDPGFVSGGHVFVQAKGGFISLPVEASKPNCFVSFVTINESSTDLSVLSYGEDTADPYPYYIIGVNHEKLRVGQIVK